MILSGLIQTATAEHQVVTHLTSKRPTSAGSSTSAPDTSNLSELIPTLLSTIEEAAGEPQDIFQAQVCLAWVHYILSETGLAATRLPKTIDETVQSLTGDGQPLSPWTEVCLIKGCYIKGMMIPGKLNMVSYLICHRCGTIPHFSRR